MTAPARVDAGSAPRRQIDLLLIVRGLAALSVVVWHAEGYKARLPPAINTPGRVAVWLFFGISGYVIGYGFIHERYRLTFPDLRDFYTNRFLRIYPLFLALSAVGWIAERLVTGQSPIGLSDLPAQLMAAQFNQSYVLNGVFWTLGIEIHFYLLAPLLVLPLLMKSSARWVLAVGLYAAALYWCDFAVRHFGWSWDGRNVVSNLPHFLAGMIACRLVAGRESRLPPASVSAAAALALLAYANWLYHRDIASFWSVWGLLLVDAAIVLLVYAHAAVVRKAFVPNAVIRPLAMLGTLSYGLYAWHPYVMKYIPWTTDHLVPLIIASIAAAYVTYRLVERRALQLKRHPGAVPDAGGRVPALVSF
jgi:peptidoglycan/LPS O-acetylase OafA/YrhL